MKLKHITYILLIGGFFASIHFYLKKSRDFNRDNRNIHLSKALNNVEEGEKINIFFINSFDINNEGSKLFKVASKIGVDQYNLLSKPLNKFDRNPKHYPFGDLIMLDFEDKQIVDGDWLKKELLFKSAYINWTLPPTLRTPRIEYPLRRMHYTKMMIRFLSPAYQLDFIIISSLILASLLCILQYLLHKIKTRKLDFFIYAVAIVLGFRIIHVVEFGGHVFDPYGMFNIPGVVYNPVKYFSTDLLFASIPLFICRYFFKLWKSKLAFVEQELIKALIALFFGSIFIILISSIKINMIQHAMTIGADSRSYRFIFDSSIKPHYLSIIPLVAIVTAISLNNFLKRAISSWSAGEALIESKANVIEVESKLNEIQSSVNPHFLYNSFNSIASLAKKDPNKTEQMTLALAKFYKYTTNRDRSSFSTILEEIEMINTYLEIEKIRFGEKLSFEIDLKDKIAQEKIPYFSLQPLVENAVKYGYDEESNGIKIKLKIYSKKKDIIIEIFDSGKAFADEFGKGYGLKSISKKLKLLYPSQHELSFHNNPKHVSIILNNQLDV